VRSSCAYYSIRGFDKMRLV